MQPEVIQLHPEVEGILREVASRPGSMLLRIPRGAESRVLREDRSIGRETRSDLSRAERHLLAVHAEEVAFALRQAAWYRLATAPKSSAFVYRQITATHVTSIPTTREMSVAAANAVRGVSEWSHDTSVIALLERLAASDTLSDVSVEALAAAAHRVVPSARGRMMAGSAFVLSGQRATGVACFTDILRSSAPTDIHAVAWHNMAHALGLEGQSRRALEAARQASFTMPDCIPFHSTRLWLAIRVLDLYEADIAARQLEAAIRGQASTLDEVVRSFDRKRWTGEGALLERQLRLAMTIADRYPESAGRMLRENS